MEVVEGGRLAKFKHGLSIKENFDINLRDQYIYYIVDFLSLSPLSLIRSISLSLSFSLFIYIYIYMNIYTYIYIVKGIWFTIFVKINVLNINDRAYVI